ncbi:hypothetical protein LTR99_006137 [Exophiala xenobiotica]|uniref:RING-type E3 ubiquitin transferase n=1 Tax=Vermiconidia calcicola TaxID=1690605 RepID=A0AAV9QFM3_9PEZI|nr:hypothetical protein LTR96_007572 [Exophiala xenobiotica]KAK5303180.1 hypothetical protein LTR99_006137 [Exophiala xenobiotica]KAK5533129.1 hypothetical protein LTR23_009331 [Chaetothyriales sp. CCFEE 6169]KAK5540791.1 hypothetical protein LTR25_002568 [Vermiconidia calcicola]
MTLCRYFQHGSCWNGDSCEYRHERDLNTLRYAEPVVSCLPAIEGLFINQQVRPTAICKYFVQGKCTKGDACGYLHPFTGPPSQEAQADASSTSGLGSRQHTNIFQEPQDSRARVPCRFLSRPGGCRNNPCPFLHAEKDHEAERNNARDVEADEDDDQECEDDFTRSLAGASIHFSAFGDVADLLLPADYSRACVTGFVAGTTNEEIVDILRGLGFEFDVESTHILLHTTSSETKATLKVKDPNFAKELATRLKNQHSTLSAMPIPIEAGQASCRKVYISWHKATKSAWLNFGNGKIAYTVAEKFNKGEYKCRGQSVKSSTAKQSQRRGRGALVHNPVAWTITLSDIPGYATQEDVKAAITSFHDAPRHIEMGPVSYSVSDAEVSVEVRTLLEKHGQLESFRLAPASEGKRVKVSAWFGEETDARSACSLNNQSLDILGKGKLTVVLVQSAKVKVRTTIYLAWKKRIDEEAKTWKENYLTFHVYQDASHSTLKVEGSSTKEVARARKILNEISEGVVLTDGGTSVWSSTLDSNGVAYRNLKVVEKELQVVIDRSKSKRQLRFYGPPEKSQQAVHLISAMLEKECQPTYEIDLDRNQFAWVMKGGSKGIEQVLGNDVAVLDVVSKKMVIRGTQQQYDAALAVMGGSTDNEIREILDGPSEPEGNCPICFCEADAPIQTWCKHTYCLECFEGACQSAASMSKGEFQVKCQGADGTCSTILSLHELKTHLSSSVFETVLKTSFEEYIQRRPDTFRYCPTPDCGCIYRCAIASDAKPRPYTCRNCFEPICTSCHARHGDYSCAEYKDIASGGYEALQRLKSELNIKDCPKCTTPMEKTEGCNHMTCVACRAHICWVCMSVFKASGPCYAHMREAHGGIGLDHLNRFAD